VARRVIDLINITVNCGYKFDLSVDGLEAKLGLLNRRRRLGASLKKTVSSRTSAFHRNKSKRT